MAETKTTTTKTAGEAFTLKTWMGGGTRPHRYVTLYAANEVQAEIDAIEQEIADAEKKASSGWPQTPGTSVLEKRLEELREQIRESAAVFKVKAMDPDANDAIARSHPFADDASSEQIALVMFQRFREQVAHQVVAFGPSKDALQPVTMTVDDVTTLRNQVGEVEYMKLVNACQETMSEVSASTPFWHGNSGTSRS